MIASVSDIKSYIGLGSDTTIDTELTALSNAAQAEVENYCNRKFESQETIEYLYSESGKDLFPKNFPITTLSKIEKLESDNTFVEIDKTYLRSVNGKVYFCDGTLFEKDTEYKLTYTAGYSTIPYDIKQTIIEMVAYAHKESGIAGGKSILGIGSIGEGGAIGITTSFKGIDWKKKIESYKSLNL